MAKKPKISIIITTYNNKDTIEACLKSIRGQNFKNFELIVVDESSKDGTQQVAKKYSNKFINQGKERCQKRNIGAENAKADYLFFVDSDMQLSKNMLEEISKKLDPKTLLMVPEISFGKGFWAKCKAFERAMYIRGDIAQGVRVYPKKIFFREKGFDENMVGVEDLDLFYRIKKHNKMKVKEIKNVLYHNEGKLTYKQIMKRINYYAKSFNKYKKRHPEMFKKQLSIKRYLKKWKYFVKHPLLAAGFIFIKGTEAFIVFHNMRKYH